MKTATGKCVTVMCLCILVAVSCSCLPEHVQTLVSKVYDLFGIKSSQTDRDGTTITPPSLQQEQQPNRDKPNVDSQQPCRGTGDETLCPLFGMDWKNVSSKITNNWWIIAVLSLLPFALFWRVQYNMRKRVNAGKIFNKLIIEWKKLLIRKEKTYATHSRRLTLPDLTLARHARRESLAEATHRLTGRPRKLSQCNISQFRSMRNSSFERNDDSPGDTKRVHYIIRRRH